MNKHIVSTLLAAFFCSSAFAGPDGAYTDGDELIASFDRMLNHQATASVHGVATDHDVLREAFAASLWSGAHAKARQPVADASSGALDGPDRLYTDGVMASFDRMLNCKPAVSMPSAATDRDVLQEAFAAGLWNSTYVTIRQPVADASAPRGVQH